MANMPNSKISLLYIMKALIEKTDETHALSTEDLIAYLAENDLEAEEKKVRRDLEVLREFGFDIEFRGRHRYYLATRPLEIEELTMLVDAVQSSSAITEEDTEIITEALKAFASDDQKKMIDRRVEVPARIKVRNNSVFHNLDTIQQAMREKKQNEFGYTSYRDTGESYLRHPKNSNRYVLTPIRLVYVCEHYYMLTFNEEHADTEDGRWMNPYRVDRMVNVKVADIPAVKDPRIANSVWKIKCRPLSACILRTRRP